MKIVFMGTPDFAAVALKSLIEAGHEITMVITQPDKEKGRGKGIAESDVKVVAKEYGLPIYQPVRIKNEESVKYLEDFMKKDPADVFVVAAFGQILPKSILDMPRLGCFNIHASLLPKYRGAAPIQWSIIDGEPETGVTIMKMDEGLDTGDMVAVSRVKIESNETGGSLFDKLAKEGGDLMVKTLPLIERGEVTCTKQNDEESTYAKMLSKDMGRLDFTKTATELERLIRGCNPWPGTFTSLNGRNLKIWEAGVSDKNGAPGEIIDVNKDTFTIGCSEGGLVVRSLQIEGKKRMPAHDFMLGVKINLGDKLG